MAPTAWALLPIAFYGRSLMWQTLPVFGISTWTPFIVINPSVFDNPLRLGQSGEPVQVETLFTEPPFEAFDIGVLGGLARIDKVQFNTMIISPSVDLAVRGRYRRSAHQGLTG